MSQMMRPSVRSSAPLDSSSDNAVFTLGRLAPMSAAGLERSHGWWNRIVAGDFDGDGDTDFIGGNLGLNGRLVASATQPATMHVKDFDRNGFLEQIVSYYNGTESYPLVLRDDLIRALPFLRSRYLSYRDYARQRVTDIFTAASTSRPARSMAAARLKGMAMFALSAEIMAFTTLTTFPPAR